MLETVFIILIILVVIWLINGYINVILVFDKVCDRAMNENIDWYLWNSPSSVILIFDYHSPFQLNSWFGFKHYFYPFEIPKGKNRG